ncbi:MAG: tRNA uridine-5-carboxymethylaminomethyl(34) synthesis GTPase MnmE, partial [Pseudomonadota bacterium]|nr:tRNA uridine-5-carboxymethylaminomethyl(34) synthesis GTPase MnmE [Pseudomonadota bacterium]
MQHLQEDTIAAVATPAGAGGIGIVRVSGPESAGIAKALTGRVPDPRLLMRTRFCDATGAQLD